MTSKLTTTTKRTSFAGCFDGHTDAAVRCRAHRPMKHIPGFTRCHWMLLLGEHLCCIALAAAKVIDFGCKTQHTTKTLILASGYHTFLLSNLLTFGT